MSYLDVIYNDKLHSISGMVINTISLSHHFYRLAVVSWSIFRLLYSLNYRIILYCIITLAPHHFIRQASCYLIQSQNKQSSDAVFTNSIPQPYQPYLCLSQQCEVIHLIHLLFQLNLNLYHKSFNLQDIITSFVLEQS